jgi:hypothetical protein
MGNFVRDLRRSKDAVEALMNHYKGLGYEVGELVGKEEQKLGDFWYRPLTDVNRTNVEVKFDMYAKRSGNLCFEKSNGTKATGIMTTQADHIMYVVPGDDTYTVFVFNPEKLRDFIENSPRITIKSGGDKKKFILALAKMTAIVADKLPEEVFFI